MAHSFVSQAASSIPPELQFDKRSHDPAQEYFDELVLCRRRLKKDKTSAQKGQNRNCLELGFDLAGLEGKLLFRLASPEGQQRWVASDQYNHRVWHQTNHRVWHQYNHRVWHTRQQLTLGH